MNYDCALSKPVTVLGFATPILITMRSSQHKRTAYTCWGKCGRTFVTKLMVIHKLEEQRVFTIHWPLSSEPRVPRDVLPNDQRVDIVRALVGLHRLQVGHVAEDRILVGDAVGA